MEKEILGPNILGEESFLLACFLFLSFPFLFFFDMTLRCYILHPLSNLVGYLLSPHDALTVINPEMRTASTCNWELNIILSNQLEWTGCKSLGTSLQS